MTHVASVGRLDATTLVDKLRDQLPAGSAQNYAAMLVLNYLYSYSEKNGLQIEAQGRLAVTALSLEYLYLAWYNDVGIGPSHRQLENWPSHMWKNPANLDIDLHSLVKQANLRLGGLKAFIRTYQPIEPEELELRSPLSLNLPSPSHPTFLETHPVGLNSKANNSEWSWSPWGKVETLKKSTAPLESLEIPGPMPRPPVEVLPLCIAESTAHFHLGSHEATSSTSLSSGSMSSCDSGLTSSSGTNESVKVAATQIGALKRLEAYLSVLGTPQPEPIQLLPLGKSRPVSLVGIKKGIRVRTLQAPVRKPIQLPLAPLTATVQKELPGSRRKPPHTLRWMTVEELKSRKGVWKTTDHRLKGNQRPPRLELVKAIMSRDTEPGIILVGGTDPSSEIASISPLTIVKGSKGSD